MDLKTFRVDKLELMRIIEEKACEIHILLISIYFVLGIFYILFGGVNNDEGWYLYASKLVYAGKIPYIDFSYTQPPLLPFIYGIPQLLFGPSLYVGRLTSLFFGLTASIFASKVAEKNWGKLAGTITLALICCNPFAVYFFTLVKTYALTSFLMALSLFFLVGNSGVRNPTRSMLSIFFMCLALGVRLSVLPAVFLLMFYILYTERKSIRTIGLSAGTAIITSAVLFLPFLIMNEDLLTFNLVWYHLGRAEAMSFFQILQNKIATLLRVVDYFFLILALMFLGLVLHISGHGEDFATKTKYYLMWLILLSVSALHLAQKPTYTDYQVMLVPLASILAGCGFTKMYGNSKDSSLRISLTLLIIIMILLTPLSQYAPGLDISGGRRPIQEVEDMAIYIRDHTPEDGKLLVFSTYVAIQANRDVLPGLEMSIFSYYPNWSTDRAEKYRVINRDLLNQYIKSKKADAILLTSSEIRTLQLEKDTMRLIEENYYLAISMHDWGQWRDTAYLYLPKDQQPSL